MSVDSEPGPTGEGRSPRRPTILLGLVAALALTAIIVFSSRPEIEGPVMSTTTLPIASESSSTTAAPTTSTPTPTTDPAPSMRTPLGEFVSGLEGELVSLQGQGSMLLITMRADSPETIITPVPGWGGGVGFDSSGAAIGMTVSTSEGPDHLFLGDGTDLIDTRFLVTSYAWQQSRPHELAAVTVDEAEGEWRLNTFVFDPTTRQISDQRSFAVFDSPRWIRAWTDTGFVLTGADEVNGIPYVEYTDAGMETLWREDAGFLDVSPTGEVLVADSSGEVFEIRLLDPSGASEVLDWAPSDFNAVRWSTSGEMIAFTSYGGETGTDWDLSVYTRNGALVNIEEIPWRVWDVQWSTDERFILMPGTDNQGTQAVIFYDRHSDTVSPVDTFLDWVQWADLRP